MTSIPVFRFAPSPNGELHLGHALSALVGFEMAQRSGGRFLLRIEDIDTARCREQFVDAIVDDLHWLGVQWEEPVLRQSQHFPDYGRAAQRLVEMGLLYPCFASRAEIAAAQTIAMPGHDPDGTPIYPQLHKTMPAAEVAERKAAGQPFALRIDMDGAIATAKRMLGDIRLAFSELDDAGRETRLEARPQLWGDAIIVRKDVPASYALAVVIDDARQGVTHVTRGQDLFLATGLQRLLQVLLGLPEPIYHHHRLILDETGRKLSKSDRDTSLKRLRDSGATPQQIRRMIKLA